MTPILGFMLSFVGLGLLLIGLSLPMMLRRVKPNYLYGFRTRKTLSSEAIWYAANAYAGRWLLGVGIVHTLASLLLYFVFQADFVTYNVACTVILLGGLIVATFLSLRYLQSL